MSFHRLVKNAAETDMRAEWTSNREHLLTLDRELAVVNCARIWVDAATAGVTPRTALAANKKLQSQRDSVARSASPRQAASPRSATSHNEGPGETVITFDKSNYKKMSHADRHRFNHIAQSCRNMALKLRSCKSNLHENLESLTQSVIEQRPPPSSPRPKKKSGGISVVSSTASSINKYFSFAESGKDADDFFESKAIDNDTTILYSPRESAFGRSRLRVPSKLEPLRNLSSRGTIDSNDSLGSLRPEIEESASRSKVVVSALAPFGLRSRSSGLLLRPSIVAMNPSARHKYVQRVLPDIVDTIADKFITEAISEHDNVKRLRPIPMLSSRAALLFSSSYDALITKQREAISTLANSEINDIMHNLRRELKTLKDMQTRLGSRWLLLLAIARRQITFERELFVSRAKNKLNRAAMKIQGAQRRKLRRKLASQMEIVRPILKPNIWWFVFKMKVKMRHQCSKLVKKFVKDYVGGVGVKSIIYKFRWKVIRTQQTVRNYLTCKKARLTALQLLWDRIEKTPAVQKELTKLKREASTSLQMPGVQDMALDDDDVTVAGNDSNSKAPYTIAGSDVSQQTFDTLGKDFHSRFLRANSVLLKASLARLGDSKALLEIESMGRWSKWRGGFARACSAKVIRDLLEPLLLEKRKAYIREKAGENARISEGCSLQDMKAFMQGETWEQLAERIKPNPIPWKLFTELSHSGEIFKLIKSGLSEQMRLDAEVELRKLSLL